MEKKGQKQGVGILKNKIIEGYGKQKKWGMENKKKNNKLLRNVRVQNVLLKDFVFNFA